CFVFNRPLFSFAATDGDGFACRRPCVCSLQLAFLYWLRCLYWPHTLPFNRSRLFPPIIPPPLIGHYGSSALPGAFSPGNPPWRPRLGSKRPTATGSTPPSHPPNPTFASATPSRVLQLGIFWSALPLVAPDDARMRWRRRSWWRSWGREGLLDL
uniref:Uncharacterized protein n=1 Tax=Aegilops tauschii subsp. strangulata TaxID=200361 RepID=A0A453EPM9_AEGTS